MAVPNEERSAGGETPGRARLERQGRKETTSSHGISWGDGAEAQVRETMTAAIELSADGFLQQINEYECIRDLGVGATAERDSQVLQNVRREVALMKKLVHPNVVRLLEVIDDPQNDLLFMAMEFVHKGPVMVWEEDRGQYVSPATGGVLPPRTAAAYFRGMLDGLEFLHANHVVHRDLKPENVLLTKDGVAKITDFGVSRIFDEQERSEANGHDVSLEREDAEYRDRHRHQLTQPEGTWCFWAPEICTTSNVAKDRVIQGTRTRAIGAEAAKSMALGDSADTGSPKLGWPSDGQKYDQAHLKNHKELQRGKDVSAITSYSSLHPSLRDSD